MPSNKTAFESQESFKSFNEYQSTPTRQSYNDGNGGQLSSLATDYVQVMSNPASFKIWRSGAGADSKIGMWPTHPPKS